MHFLFGWSSSTWCICSRCRTKGKCVGEISWQEELTLGWGGEWPGNMSRIAKCYGCHQQDWGPSKGLGRQKSWEVVAPTGQWLCGAPGVAEPWAREEVLSFQSVQHGSQRVCTLEASPWTGTRTSQGICRTGWWQTWKALLGLRPLNKVMDNPRPYFKLASLVFAIYTLYVFIFCDYWTSLLHQFLSLNVNWLLDLSKFCKFLLSFSVKEWLFIMPPIIKLNV